MSPRAWSPDFIGDGFEVDALEQGPRDALGIALKPEVGGIMTPMTSQTTGEILNAAGHLPVGAKLVVPQVAWEDYERLLEDLAERSHLRVRYDCGRLEIMSPSREHEMIVCLIEDLVLLYCLTFQLALDKFGHTTWRHDGTKKDVEPDACYSIRDTQRAAGKRSFNLPPDIAVEIDMTPRVLQEVSPLRRALRSRSLVVRWGDVPVLRADRRRLRRD